MNRKEGIKNLSLTCCEIEMLKYIITDKIIELSSWIESYPEYVEILEAVIQRYSYLYEKLDEALL